MADAFHKLTHDGGTRSYSVISISMEATRSLGRQVNRAEKRLGITLKLEVDPERTAGLG